jgi:tetratricopeptide (TPR) repeat protein
MFGLALTLATVLVGGLDAQEAAVLEVLPLKRDLPALPADACEARAYMFAPVATPSAEAAAEAQRLASEASQAAILGQYEQARELLNRAAALDRTSTSVSYALGRLLEDGGDQEGALREYCRFLTLGGESSETEEVEGRVESVGRSLGVFGAEGARAALEAGIGAFDRGDYDEAVRQFSGALVELPDWDQAHFNRAVAYLRSGRQDAGIADLEWYLEISPGAADRLAVEAQLAALEPPAEALYNPRTALVTGLILPGMGHFYSGRPAYGILLLGTAGVSAGFGLLYKKIEIQCLSIPDPDCPVEDQLPPKESRPFLVPGLATAGAITLFGAINAYRGARLGPVQLSRNGGIQGTIPQLSMGESVPVFRIEPRVDRDGGALRAELEVRF